MFEIPMERIIEALYNLTRATKDFQVYWRKPWLHAYDKCTYMFPGDTFTLDPINFRFYNIGGLTISFYKQFLGVSQREYLIFEKFSKEWDYVDLSEHEDGQQLLRADLQKEVEEHELSEIDWSKLQSDISELKNEIEGLKNDSISLGSAISPSNLDFSAVKLNLQVLYGIFCKLYIYAPDNDINVHNLPELLSFVNRFFAVLFLSQILDLSWSVSN
ncbi:hypothetical protein IHE45_17G011500 [Dioscorea alata]|uniref:Uncharacterized protein n=1 Tax=Dioscorea alata TaxID=55571 RepID=A0ACB7UAJ2_DIOAL|nr:hypothetical protein IHE45_17G011500 [Dioscorea alata]